MKKCTKCNSAYTDDKNYCRNCGSLLVLDNYVPIKKENPVTETTDSLKIPQPIEKKISTLDNPVSFPQPTPVNIEELKKTSTQGSNTLQLEAIPYDGIEEGIDAIIIEKETVSAPSITPESIPEKEELTPPIQETIKEQPVKQPGEISITAQAEKRFSLVKIFLVVGIIAALGVAVFLWGKYSDAKSQSINLEKQRLEQIIAQVNQAVAQQQYELALRTLDNINWQLNRDDNKEYVEQYNNQRENLRQIIAPLNNRQDSLNKAAKVESDKASIEMKFDVMKLFRFQNPNEVLDFYGTEYVSIKDALDNEGGVIGKSAIIFPGTNNQIELKFIADESKLSWVDLTLPNSQWNIPMNLKVGMPLNDVVKINNKDFKIYGFEWDGAGQLSSWDGGNLENSRVGIVVAPNDSTFKAYTIDQHKSYEQVVGDKTFSTANENIRNLGLTIKELYIKHDSI